MLRKKKVWVILMALVVIIFFLTHDIILTNILAHRICSNSANSKTFIKETVEYPDSIYWEDNIYPGFDEDDRLLMIQNYLNGEHLRTMALNGPDGLIYLYTATQTDWRRSSVMEKNTEKDWKDYFFLIEEEAKNIAARVKIISRKNKPELAYSVIFNPVKLSSFEEKYLYSDEVTITDNLKNEVIASNRRLMRFWYTIAPDVGLGNRYYYPYLSMCGDSEIYGFDENIFIFYKDVPFQPAHLGVNRYLYEKLVEENKHVK